MISISNTYALKSNTVNIETVNSHSEYMSLI